MRPLVIAHRGARPAAENSLASITRAAELGLDGVELDVRRCRSGELVLVHDRRVRLRPVRGLTLIELARRLPAVTTLPEAIMALGTRPSLRLSLHVKERDVVTAALVAIVAAGLDDRTVLVSYDVAALRIARDAAPSVERGLILPLRRSAIPFAALAEVRAGFVVSDQPRALRPDERVAITGHGLSLEVGRVETAPDALLHAGAGARALISDHPVPVRAALDR